jgi:hypothetical protein
MLTFKFLIINKLTFYRVNTLYTLFTGIFSLILPHLKTGSNLIKSLEYKPVDEELLFGRSFCFGLFKIL